MWVRTLWPDLPVQSSQCVSLFLTLLCQDMEGESRGKVFHSQEGWQGLQAPGQQWLSQPAWAGKGCSGDIPWRAWGQRLCPHRARRELSRGKKRSRSALLLSWASLTAHPAELGPPWRQTQELQHVLPFHQLKIRAVLELSLPSQEVWSWTTWGFGKSKLEAVELLALNHAKALWMPKDGVIFILPGINNWM